MSTSPILLKSIQHEYENSPLTKEQLCSKHNISEEDLGNHQNWIKNPKYSASIEDTPPSSSTEVIDVELDNTDNTSDIDIAPTDGELLLAEINKTSKVMLKGIQEVIASEELEPKDYKDLSKALIDLKDASIGKEPAMAFTFNTNNINSEAVQIIQGIMGGVQDDC